MALADAQPAGEVVHPQGAAQRAGEPAVDQPVLREHRDEERQDAHEVRRVAQRDLALGEVLVDEPELALLQVAEPAVHELRALRRRARREVVALDERGAQAPARGVERDPGAGDAAADDEHVELLVRQPCERLRPVEGRRPARRVHSPEATAGSCDRPGPIPGRDELVAL